MKRGKLRGLILEDDYEVAFALKLTLETIGINNVDIFEDKLDVLEDLFKNCTLYDLMILDTMNCGKPYGPEFLEKAREFYFNFGHKPGLIIATSGSNCSENLWDGKRSVDYFLKKPYGPGKLLNLIEEHFPEL